MPQSQPKLFEYGIQLERSDVRVHVSPATCSLYVFSTVIAQKLLDMRGAEFPERSAYQPGIEYVTAIGKLVPCHEMPQLRMVTLKDYAWWRKFNRTDPTTRKGRMAVSVACWALRNGYLPLWIPGGTESKSHKLQRSGTDILLWANLRIQVKCDWFAGPVDLGGSGNLFLQQAELNPHKHY